MMATVMAGKGHDQQDAGDQCGPGKDRHAHQSSSGARLFRIVTMKLKAPSIDRIPEIVRPTIQKSTAREGFQARSVGGHQAYQPDSGASPKNQLIFKGETSGQEQPVAEGIQPRHHTHRAHLFAAAPE
ncbi:MAG: hypothetical protein M9953_03760 [Thermomicrobiales bacterium]|nr:hypothetical protein [Thermomicrobiales bacterium]